MLKPKSQVNINKNVPAMLSSSPPKSIFPAKKCVVNWNDSSGSAKLLK